MEKYKVTKIETGIVAEWSIEEMLYEINRDRTDEWTTYDRSDWLEGWMSFVEGELYSIDVIQAITTLLRDSDLTFRMIFVEFLGNISAERIVPALRQMQKYGSISKNEKLHTYGKSGEMWFTIRSKSKK